MWNSICLHQSELVSKSDKQRSVIMRPKSKQNQYHLGFSWFPQSCVYFWSCASACVGSKWFSAANSSAVTVLDLCWSWERVFNRWAGCKHYTNGLSTRYTTDIKGLHLMQRASNTVAHVFRFKAKGFALLHSKWWPLKKSLRSLTKRRTKTLADVWRRFVAALLGSLFACVQYQRADGALFSSSFVVNQK